MKDLRYIFGEPIELKGIGLLYPMKLKIYIKHNDLFNVLSITLKNLLQTIPSNDHKKRHEVEETIKCFDLICTDKKLLEMLIKLLTLSFKTDEVYFFAEKREIHIQQKTLDGKNTINLNGVINRDNYDLVRNFIIAINNIRLPKQAKTKELQEWFDEDAKFKAKKNKGDFEDTITSIMAFAHYTPKQIKKFTVYQVNKIIERIMKITEYETNVQFICAGAEKVKLDHWCSYIEDEEKEVSLDEFAKSFSFKN